MNCDDCILKGQVQVFGFGPKEAELVLVGEAPGVEEVREGKPFVGRAGKVLDRALKRAGIKKDSCYITNAVICHPLKNVTPTPKEILNCRDRLVKSILLRNPKLIVVLGNIPYYSIFPKGRVGGVKSRRGLFFDSEEFSCKVLQTLHPAAVLRDPTLYGFIVEDLKKAVSYLEFRPGAKKYQVLSNEKEIFEFLEELERRRVVAFDIETTGLDPWNDVVLSYAFSFKEKEAYCIFTNEKPGFWEDNAEAWKRIEQRVKNFLEHKETKLIIQNALYEIPFLKVAKGFDIHCYFDTLPAHHLLDENAKGQHGLKRLATRYPDLLDYSKEVDVTKLKYLEPPRFVNYTCSDVDATWRLYNEFLLELKKQKLDWLFFNITMPLTYVLPQMMVRGVKVDVDFLVELKSKYERNLSKIEFDMQEQCGDVNLSSPKQLKELLYDKLKLPALKRTPSGAVSTDDETLRLLLVRGQQVDLIKKILKHRKFSKLYRTYLLGIAKRVNRKTERVHTEYLIHGTVSGRLASANPNMQNIANEVDIKNLFVAPEGWKIIDADYKQLEYRVFINYAKDKKAYEDLRTGLDVHRLIASKTLHKRFEDVTDKERSHAKGVTFGLLYGMATETLAKEYNMSYSEASKFVQNFFMMYPKAKEWRDNLRESLRKNGEVVNLYGRRRRLPAIFSNVQELCARALREGFNSPIQGGAADITNYCLVRLYHYLVDNGYKARPILQVHDSIVLEVPDKEVIEVAKIVEEQMTKDIPGVTVPLAVDVRVYQRWGEGQSVTGF